MLSTGETQSGGSFKTGWPEWGVIVLAICVYCLPGLAIGSQARLPGPEAQYFQTFDQILEASLKGQGQFPLWNPYYFTGLANVAHPMLHTYNPLVSLPILLFGTLNGFKLAVLLGFIVAGLGMDWLGRELGLNRVLRIWIALMYACSGVPAAKFIQGQYLMVLAFGWIPFSLAALLATVRTRRRVHICAAALGLALLFLCGDAYYAYYMLYVIAIFTLAWTCSLQRNQAQAPPDRADFWRLAVLAVLGFVCPAVIGLAVLYLSGNLYYSYYLLFACAVFALVLLAGRAASPLRLVIKWADVKLLLAIGLLSLGLISVQLLPELAYRERYTKEVNTELSDSRDIPTTFLDFVSPDPFRPGGFTPQLRPEEYYAYIGWGPILALLLLPLAWGPQSRRGILLMLGLAVFTFAWIDVKDMPWHSLFQTLPLLYQFRFPSRMGVVGVMALVTAGGVGLDALWRRAQSYAHSHTVPGRQLVASLPMLAVGILLLWSLGDLALTTSPLIHPSKDVEPRDQVAAWLKAYDPGLYYVSAPNAWDQALIGNGLRYLDGGYALYYLRDYTDQISAREIQPTARYAIAASTDPAPAGSTLLKAFPTARIYSLAGSLPFAFSMSTDTLTTPAATPLAPGEVTPETFTAPNVNQLEGDVQSDTDGVLVLLSTFTPDWQVTIDGNPDLVYSAYGFMAAQVTPGRHRFVFVFRPFWFYVGLGISLASLLVIFLLLLGELWAGLQARRRTGSPQAFAIRL